MAGIGLIGTIRFRCSDHSRLTVFEDLVFVAGPKNLAADGA